MDAINKTRHGFCEGVELIIKKFLERARVTLNNFSGKSEICGSVKNEAVEDFAVEQRKSFIIRNFESPQDFPKLRVIFLQVNFHVGLEILRAEKLFKFVDDSGRSVADVKNFVSNFCNVATGRRVNEFAKKVQGVNQL